MTTSYIGHFIRLLSKRIWNKGQLSASDFDRIVDQVKARVASEPPPKIAVIGDTGVGKSSTINALFNAGRPVSHTVAETQIEAEVTIAHETLEGERGSLIIFDMPGLDESLDKQDGHLETYRRVLKKVDVALWILDAQNRAIGHIQAQLREIIASNPELTKQLVVALNKVDLVHPGAHAWHPLVNLPSPEQEANIQARLEDVRNKITLALPGWTGAVVGFSAEKRYNLPKLFSVMLDAVPAKRQWVLTSRKALADFLELVDERLRSPKLHEARRVEDASNAPQLDELLKAMPKEEYETIASSKEAMLAWIEKSKT